MLRWALEKRWCLFVAVDGGHGRRDAFTPSEQRVVEFNRRMGVTAGYTISFRSVSARTKGAIALTARAGMTQDAVEQVWPSMAKISSS